MKISFFVLLFFALLFSSCQEEPKNREIRQNKDAEKREAIFNTIDQGWKYHTSPTNETTRSLLNTWPAWREFLSDLAQKPKNTIGAFQQKAKTLSKRINEMSSSIPEPFNIPEIRSRIAVLATKINSVNLNIHLNQIPDKKIIQLIQEINVELDSLQQQFDETIRKSKIKMEDGESDMIKMLDTARAIPSVKQEPTVKEKPTLPIRSKLNLLNRHLIRPIK